MSLGGIAFDAVVSLRAALDQAGYTIAKAAGKSGRKAHFPFGDTRTEALSRRGSPAKELPQEIFDRMISFEPYKGGNGLLWAVNRLCNSHKHEIVTATAIYVGSGEAKLEFAEVHEFAFPPEWDSTKNEMVLAVVPAKANTRYNFKIAMLVAFANVDFLARIPALDALNDMARIVENIIATLEVESRKLGLIK